MARSNLVKLRRKCPRDVCTIRGRDTEFLGNTMCLDPTTSPDVPTVAVPAAAIPGTPEWEARRERQRRAEAAYRERNRERRKALVAAQGARYRERHREAIAARKRAAAATEAARERRRAKYAANPEPIRESVRRSRLANGEAVRLRNRAYYAENTEQFRVYRMARRVRIKQAEGSFTLKEWAALLDAFGHRCGYCGAGGKMSRDHRIPLSRGGSNWIENIIPACEPCNARKRERTESEFRAVLASEGWLWEDPAS